MYYRKIEKKISECSMCSLSNLEINKSLGHTYGYGGSKAMIVGISPSYLREKSLYPLSKDYSHQTAGILFKVLEEINWPISDTYFTNILKCSTNNNDQPHDEMLDTCFNTFFKQELFLTNPKFIIALGKLAFNYLDKHHVDNLYYIEHHAYIRRNISERYTNWKDKWETYLKYF